MQIDIISLNKDNFQKALKLRDKIFPNLNKLDYETLIASIDSSKKDTLSKLKINSINYWLAIDLNTKDIVGIVGLYCEKNDENNIWLGWYGVDEKYRGFKIGKKLLNFAINEAKKTNKSKLKLYTTIDDEYKNARILYEKMGFVCTTKSKKAKELVYELDLN